MERRPRRSTWGTKRKMRRRPRMLVRGRGGNRWKWTGFWRRPSRWGSSDASASASVVVCNVIVSSQLYHNVEVIKRMLRRVREFSYIDGILRPTLLATTIHSTSHYELYYWMNYWCLFGPCVNICFHIVVVSPMGQYLNKNLCIRLMKRASKDNVQFNSSTDVVQ